MTVRDTPYVERLRRNADLADKSTEFMSDPDMAEEAREDADFWRRCAAEIERVEDALRELVEAVEPKLGTMNFYFGPGARTAISIESQEAFMRIKAAVDRAKEILRV